MSRAPRSCHATALGLLARRDHFRAELARKLDQRGFDADEVDGALERLTDAGLLDDDKAARAYVRARQRRAPLGRIRLLAELRAKGVDEHIAENALEELEEHHDQDAAQRAAEHWLGCSGAQRKGPPGLARHLERRGFPAGVIVDLLERYRDRFAS
ncbi:MAG: regulatory protein RecX [Acidobacteriota bacterium]